MPTFRTKIREVEAFQFNGQPLLEFPPWAQDPRYIQPSGTALYAYTISGPLRVEKGSWLIQGKSEIYPCLDKDFQERYEPVEMNALELGAALRKAGESSYED